MASAAARSPSKSRNGTLSSLSPLSAWGRFFVSGGRSASADDCDESDEFTEAEAAKVLAAVRDAPKVPTPPPPEPAAEVTEGEPTGVPDVESYDDFFLVFF